jgi:hypothetical protein
VKKNLKRIRDLYPDLKKAYDPLKPIQQQGTERKVRHLMNGNLDEASSEVVDLQQADHTIQKEGMQHPNKVKMLNALRRKLGIN